MRLHLNRFRLGVVSLKEINGDLGKEKLVRYSHLLVFKYSESERSLTSVDCVVLVYEMFITSYAPLLNPSGSWIVGGVWSQFTGKKPQL